MILSEGVDVVDVIAVASKSLGEHFVACYVHVRVYLILCISKVL